MMSFIFYIFVFWVLYRVFDKFKGTQNFSHNKRVNFKEANYLIALLAKVAKGDGRVHELEARIISETITDMSYQTGIDRDEFKKIFNKEKECISDAYDVARRYKDEFRLNRQVAIARITFFLNLAYIDGDFAPSEQKIIKEIANGFGIDDDLLDTIIYRFDTFYRSQQRYRQNRYNNSSRSNDTQNKKLPYEILGVSKDSDFKDIKKRYRELVKKYHPDILMGQGESDEVIEKSTKKLQEINEAYEEIKQQRGEN
ncbi:DnaJ-like membrane chaperone protein (N-terminal terB-like domain) [Campylobacter pinnipediorum subsp. caledonicus]|uniref:DnaJ-like membrane chaperone protein (N-terminal terB-like domain) n=1 Tax=Campylobacter pinnipediorum subsp. caledonicus TaxID=1874362 RepID=A0A1S6U767_9BACT|nr:DnaJ domain-containing protein [Campylobacter pinnipediorum]AQW85921.1 DnaJ-like membrane chaperone protein (N-terminal terB-like domain) [Campylobacter pinnipediorum subsp. caledonicus]AQW87529.1 DnaJ-like membrane chaperone protein (N-terminal terB-like domain) [Campylobacter pinnipediorum subsp. caledonicus]